MNGGKDSGKKSDTAGANRVAQMVANRKKAACNFWNEVGGKNGGEDHGTRAKTSF